MQEVALEKLKQAINEVVSLALKAGEEMGVQRRGKKWEVAVDIGERYPGGRKKYHREGGFYSEEQAKRREAELLQELLELQERKPINKTKFEDIALKWLVKKRNDIRFSSWKRYEGILNNHIIPYFKNVYIKDIGKTDIESYYELKKKKYRQSLPKHRAVINQIFEMAEEDKIIEDNIALLAEMPASAEPRKHWITEPKELWTFILSFKGSCLFLPVLLAGGAGLRLSEIVALIWQDINFKYGYATVNKSQHFHPENGGIYVESTKTAKSARKVYLSKTILQVLENVKKERKAKNSDHVCLNSRGKPFRNNTLSTNFRRAARAEKRGGYNLSFKSLRSSYATIMRDMGINEVAIQEDLGHSELSTTQKHYFKTTRKQRQELKNAKEELFKNL